MKTIEYQHERYCHVYANSNCTCNAKKRAAMGIARRLAGKFIELHADSCELDDFDVDDEEVIRQAMRDLGARLLRGPI